MDTAKRPGTPYALAAERLCRAVEIAALMEDRRRMNVRLDFYMRRVQAIQDAQMKMRDPERTMVCDILANGSLLHPITAGRSRYEIDRAPVAREGEV